MNKAEKVINSCFVQFLKTNGAFAKYKYECNRNQVACITLFKTLIRKYYIVPKGTADDELAYNYAKDFIMSSFSWPETIDGVMMWSKLYKGWKHILEDLKNNNYEISENISRAILTRCYQR